MPHAFNHDLWRRIEGFAFDEPGTTFRFRDRLAKENAWSTARAEQAINEYRRFLYLAAAAGHPVSPPDEIDQVWHLHLMYTRSYWDRLCRDTLGTSLHHEPTRGGSDETAKFADWYARTLASYQDAFHEAPPPDIWPGPGEKRSKPDYKRVDVSKYLLFPKARFAQAAMIMIALLALLAVASGCDASVPTTFPHTTSFPLAAVENPLNMRGSDFLSFFAFAAVAAIAVALALRWQARRAPSGAHPNANLDPYETAYLRESPALAVRAALANLVSQGAMQLTPGSTFERVSPSSRAAHPLEEAILLAGANPASAMTIERRVRPALDSIANGLVEKGLLVGPSERNMAAIGTLALLAAAAIGVAKVVVGISRDRPVLFLVMMVAALVIVMFALMSRRLHRTRAGDEAIENMKNRYRREAMIAQSQAGPPADTAPDARRGPAPAMAYGGFDPITMMVALYGMNMLMHHPTLAPMQQAFVPPAESGWSGGTESASDSDADSSDSGGGDSSCSSGCGGCGGGD